MPQYQGIWNLAQQAQALTRQQWVTDPLFDQTTLLLQGDNVSGSSQNNVFVDSSTNNFLITRNGNTTQGAFSPFSLQSGEWGNFFNGSSDFLNIGTGYPASLNLGSSDFTIEGWVYLQATTKQLMLGNLNDANGSCTFFIMLNNTTAPARYEVKLGSTAYNIGSGTIPTNQWVHICLMRSGTNVFLFENGVQVGTTQTYSGSITSLSNQMRVGGAIANQYPLSGYASNLRMVIGSVVYSTSGFTVPTSPLTPITNTALLVCQSNRFIDSSTNAIAVTTSGAPSVQPFSPFAPQYQYTPTVTGGSGYFDGTGDYLTSSNFNLGTNAFTIEGWFYVTSTAGNMNYWGMSNGGGSTPKCILYMNNAGNLVFETGSVSGAVISVPISTNVRRNAWQHIAISRSGTGANQTAMFIDGVRAGTGTSGNFSTSTASFNVGYIGEAFGVVYNGYISGFRVVNGTAVYDPTQTSVAVPTAPPTAVTNTQLLCNFTNAGILDGTMKNNLETVGNAQVSANAAKYGPASLYFDGTGDYLLPPSGQNFVFGTGNFTIECWVHPLNFTAFRAIIDTRSSTTSATGYLLSLANATTGAWSFFKAGTTVVASNTNLVLSVWQHIAVVRLNSVTTLYLNGMSVGSANDTQAYTDSGCRVGSTIDNVSWLGYIDDLRITKGIARYTRNFTPPQVALPRQ